MNKPVVLPETKAPAETTAPEPAIAADLQRYFADHSDTYAGAFLFGSLATKTQTANSDLDIAVVPTGVFSADDKFRLISDLAKLSGRPVDVVNLMTANGPILKQALTTGLCVHRSNPDAIASAGSRMLAYETDVAPLVMAAEKQQVEQWLQSQQGNKP